MTRRIATLFIASLFVAATASATTQGFSAQFEENFQYPKVNTFMNADFAAPVGTFVIMTQNTIYYTDNDPVRGPFPCDPTTSKGLELQAGTFDAHIRFEFPMAAQGDKIILDKMHVGAESGDRFGMEFGVYSAVTDRYEPMFQFGPANLVLIYGQPVDDGTGNWLEYDNVFANDCVNGIDNHFEIVARHDLKSGTVAVELSTKGDNAQTFILGPFQMNPETQAEGIRGMYALARGGSGRFWADGMVCNGTSIVIEPVGGSDHNGGGRSRY